MVESHFAHKDTELMTGRCRAANMYVQQRCAYLPRGQNMVSPGPPLKLGDPRVESVDHTATAAPRK